LFQKLKFWNSLRYGPLKPEKKAGHVVPLGSVLPELLQGGKQKGVQLFSFGAALKYQFHEAFIAKFLGFGIVLLGDAVGVYKKSIPALYPDSKERRFYRGINSHGKVYPGLLKGMKGIAP
jgi:hypothetical protein